MSLSGMVEIPRLKDALIGDHVGTTGTNKK